MVFMTVKERNLLVVLFLALALAMTPALALFVPFETNGGSGGGTSYTPPDYSTKSGCNANAGIWCDAQNTCLKSMYISGNLDYESFPDCTVTTNQNIVASSPKYYANKLTIKTGVQLWFTDKYGTSHSSTNGQARRTDGGIPADPEGNGGGSGQAALGDDNHGKTGGDGGAGGALGRSGGDGYIGYVAAARNNHCNDPDRSKPGFGGKPGSRLLLYVNHLIMEKNSNFSVNGLPGTDGKQGGDDCNYEGCWALCEHFGGSGGGAGGGGGAGSIVMYGRFFTINETAKITAIGGAGGVGGPGGNENGKDDSGWGGSGGGGAGGDISIYTLTPPAVGTYPDSLNNNISITNLVTAGGAGAPAPNKRESEYNNATVEYQGERGSQGTVFITQSSGESSVPNGCINDMKDNDEDGFIDFEDNDCTDTSNPVLAEFDFNGPFIMPNPLLNTDGGIKKDDHPDPLWNPFATDGSDGVCGDDDASCRVRTCEELTWGLSCGYYGCEHVGSCIVNPNELVACTDIRYQSSCTRTPYCQWVEETKTTTDLEIKELEAKAMLDAPPVDTTPSLPRATGMLSYDLVGEDGTTQITTTTTDAYCTYKSGYTSPPTPQSWQDDRCDGFLGSSCNSKFACTWKQEKTDEGAVCTGGSTTLLDNYIASCSEKNQYDCLGICTLDKNKPGDAASPGYATRDGGKKLLFYCNNDYYNKGGNVIVNHYPGGDTKWKWWAATAGNMFAIHTYGRPVDYLTNGDEWYVCGEDPAYTLEAKNIIPLLSTFPPPKGEAWGYCPNTPMGFDPLSHEQDGYKLDYWTYALTSEQICGLIVSENGMNDGYHSYFASLMSDHYVKNNVDTAIIPNMKGCCYYTTSLGSSFATNNISFVKDGFRGRTCTQLICKADFANQQETCTGPDCDDTSTTSLLNIADKDLLFGETIKIYPTATSCRDLEGPNSEAVDVCDSGELCIPYSSNSYEITISTSSTSSERCCVGGYCRSAAASSCEELGGYLFPNNDHINKLYECKGESVETRNGRCCVGKIDVRPGVTDIYNQFPQNQSFICYEGANGRNMFAECCAEYDCKNVNTWNLHNQVFGGLGDDNGRIFTKGSQLRTIISFDKVLPGDNRFMDGVLNITVDVSMEKPTAIAGPWSIPSYGKPGYYTNWEDYDYLTFDMRYYGGYEVKAIIFDLDDDPTNGNSLPPIPLKDYSLIPPQGIGADGTLPPYLWHRITIDFSSSIMIENITIGEALALLYPESIPRANTNVLGTTITGNLTCEEVFNDCDDPEQVILEHNNQPVTLGDFIDAPIRSFHFTLANPNPSVGDEVTVQADNFVLHKDDETDNYYCSGEFKTWLEDLVADDHNGDGEISFDERAPEMIACNMQLSYRWTGTKCCGANSIRPPVDNRENPYYYQSGEYYTDTEGACWGGVGITDGQIVPTAYGGDYNAWPHILYKRDTFGTPVFWSCNKTMPSFSDAAGSWFLNSTDIAVQHYFPGNVVYKVMGEPKETTTITKRCSCDVSSGHDCGDDFLLADTAPYCYDHGDYGYSEYQRKEVQMIAIVPPFSIIGEYYCDPAQIWLPADNLKRVKVLATKLYEMAGNNYTLHCDNFDIDIDSMNTTSLHSLGVLQRVTSGPATACVLRNETTTGPSITIGIPLPDPASENIDKTDVANTFITSLYKSFYPLNRTNFLVSGMEQPDCSIDKNGVPMPDELDLDQPSHDFFIECWGSGQVDTRAEYVMHFRYNKPLNILIISMDKPVTPGFFANVWQAIRGLFSGMFRNDEEPMTATTIMLDLDYQADFSHLYMARNGDAEIRGIMELNDLVRNQEKWVVRVDYNNFGASVEPLLEGYRALGITEDQGRLCSQQGNQTIYLSFSKRDAIAQNFDWRYLTSNLRLQDIGQSTSFTSDPSCWLHNGVVDHEEEDCDDFADTIGVIAQVREGLTVDLSCARCVEGKIDNTYCAFNRFFIYTTRNTTKGNMNGIGGVPGADRLCAKEAEGIYTKASGAQAIISTSSLSAEERFASYDKPVYSYRTSNQPPLELVDDINSLFPENGFGLTSGTFLFDATGEVAPADAQFWTGTYIDGTTLDSHCNNWQSAIRDDTGGKGDHLTTVTNNVAGRWLFSARARCDAEKRLICIVPVEYAT